MNGLIDTNILVYAANRQSSWHAKACSFLEKNMEEQVSLYLCWPVIYEFLRVTTHPKVFSKPLRWKEAHHFMNQLLSHASFTILKEGEDHYALLKELTNPLKNPSGNFVHDCHIATILKENGIKMIYTKDGDFRNFSFLEMVDPLS